MIDYEKALNTAQLAAVTNNDPAALVIAGAGSGKTRVIVYRLAWLVEHGISPESILLMTFTRKAANEMLERAAKLLGQGMNDILGGTFHSFAYSFLRAHPPAWLSGRNFTLMDASDIVQAIKQCRDALKIGKKDSSFPKTQTIAAILSKARNKELNIEELIRKESFHLLPYAGQLEDIGKSYANFKRANGLLDYDDLLSEMENALRENGSAVTFLKQKLNQILVDEYQDTNLVQARIVRLLSQEENNRQIVNVMAVGDDAQSIYAFRGANVRNILDFPKLFPEYALLRLEENYRSTQPILDAANDVLSHAAESFHKNLFTSRTGGEPVRIIRPLSDTTQAALVVNQIKDLLQNCLPHEIAVLFRSGFHSYPLENALRQAGINFKKYGGLKFVEAAHVKDVLSFARLVLNPLDLPAFTRVAAMHKGVGVKTIAKLHDQLVRNDVQALRKSLSRHEGLLKDLMFIDQLRLNSFKPGILFEKILEYYRPNMETLYPEDWPSRLQGLEEVLQIAQAYEDLDLFVADLALESPESDDSPANEHHITLSTVHSAKGLEWTNVIIIDLVEDRFPSRHALAKDEDFEEERRLFYVACTRARNTLTLYAPQTVYSRQDGASVPVNASPFLQEIKNPEKFREDYAGNLMPVIRQGSENNREISHKTMPVKKASPPIGGHKTVYCRHRIFGRGKIIKYLDEDKVQVNFPGFGLKVILACYLQMDE